jgi:hypothetical protein
MITDDFLKLRNYMYYEFTAIIISSAQGLSIINLLCIWPEIKGFRSSQDPEESPPCQTAGAISQKVIFG